MTELLVALFVKHFVVDFMLQTPYMYLNKGTYLHGGGILHATLHGMATAFILASFVFLGTIQISLFVVFLIALAEAIAHYHIDWAKVKTNTHYGLKPDNSEKYWWLLGFDQLLHSLTYVAIFAFIF